MSAKLLRSLLARSAPAAPDAALWERLTSAAPLLGGLDDNEMSRLRRLATDFAAAKSIETVGAIEVDDELRYAIAVQAALPVLNLGLEWYDDWRSVIVYPGNFLARQEYIDEAGVVHHLERPLSGEAWPDGPVVLSLEGVMEGITSDYADNLVVHEMAHKLDLSNGVANGMPALHVGMDRKTWTVALSSAYEDFSLRLERGEDPVFDDYAGEDPAEFFAVMSEAFFLEPVLLARVYAEVYRQLALFYRQDPVERGAR